MRKLAFFRGTLLEIFHCFSSLREKPVCKSQKGERVVQYSTAQNCKKGELLLMTSPSYTRRISASAHCQHGRRRDLLQCPTQDVGRWKKS